MKWTNEHNIPLSLAVMLAHDEYPEHPEKTISVTTLLKPVKQIILSQRVASSGNSSRDIAGNIASSIGTAIHNGVEAAWKSPKLPQTLESLGFPSGLSIQVNPEDREIDLDSVQVYTEYRTTKEFMGWTISGEFDFVAEGRVRDIKSTGVFTYMNGTMDDKYPLQGSLYRWLNPEKITDDVMAIDYVFTDWSALAAKTQANYPPVRIMEKLYQLKSISDTEKFIADKLNKINDLYESSEAEIPQCTEEELWCEPTKWKYYKNPASAKRATKVYDNPNDANAHLIRDGRVGAVIEHKGQVKACRYCDALPICEQAKRYVNSGELKL